MGLFLRDISHRFGDLSAVDHADLHAERGEIVCLFGPSGCGKTTLLRIAAGLEPLQQGIVELGGAILGGQGQDMPPERRPIGFVFQDYVLFPHMTVEQNIAFGLNKKGPETTALVTAELAAMGLQGLAKRYPHELSGGQQQRVALARALILKPQALLLDEPFASIDAALRRRLREEMRRVLKQQNVAVVLVTHDPEEALALGDKIALMRGGKIVEAASPKELFECPASPEGAMIFPGSQTFSGAIKNNVMLTLVGEFTAHGLPDGTGTAVIREHGLRAHIDPAGSFIVRDRRFTGPDWTVFLSRVNGPGEFRVLMGDCPEIGAQVDIVANPSCVFIF